jgi:hypothetical protein
MESFGRRRERGWETHAHWVSINPNGADSPQHRKFGSAVDMHPNADSEAGQFSDLLPAVYIQIHHCHPNNGLADD